MIDPVNAFEQHVGARLLDFFGRSTPWHRRLWSVGMCLTLQEILEASEAVRAGALSEISFGSLANSAQAMAGTDPGAGTIAERQNLQAALRSKPRFGGLEYFLVSAHETKARATYLTNWATAIRSEPRPGAERTARSIAAHLLDQGYSDAFLHRWWKYHLQHEPQVRSLADLVEKAQAIASAESQLFQLLVPVSTAVRWHSGSGPDQWRNARGVSDWFRAHGFDSSGVRQDGGFLFEVSALDHGSAVIRVLEVLDQLKARMAVGSRRALRLEGRVWVQGHPVPQAIDSTARGVWAEALDRENQLYDSQSTGGINASIELLSHLQSSSPGAAVAGGWAAIEALLGEPNDRAGAAERLAMLVACSFPRAELTALSYALPRRDAEIAARLVGVTENRARCSIVLAALRDGKADLSALSKSDHAAALRMIQLASDAHRVLADIQEHAAIGFRRLYRQRNIVLHWGKTDGSPLRASLRTTAPLVGAGIDRIIHAHYVDRLTPLQLVARAKLGLATVDGRGGPTCTSLLG